MPYYHHELVKRALVMAADDSKGHDSPLLLKLLSELASSGAINQAGHINAVGISNNCTYLEFPTWSGFRHNQWQKRQMHVNWLVLLKSICVSVHAYRSMSAKHTGSYIRKWYDKCKVHVCSRGQTVGQMCSRGQTVGQM